jgi:hypothetical protein
VGHFENKINQQPTILRRMAAKIKNTALFTKKRKTI